MNNLSIEQMRHHTQIVAWLNIAGSILGLLAGVFVIILLPAIGVLSNDRDALGILTLIGFGLGIFMLALALPGLLAGIGLLRRKNWGRVLAIIISALNLLNIPLGTLIGGYSLFVLFQDAATTYFE